MGYKEAGNFSDHGIITHHPRLCMCVFFLIPMCYLIIYESCFTVDSAQMACFWLCNTNLAYILDIGTLLTLRDRGIMLCFAMPTDLSFFRYEICIFVIWWNFGDSLIADTVKVMPEWIWPFSSSIELFVDFFLSHSILRNIYALTVLCVNRYFKTLYFELLDPEILSSLHKLLNKNE